MNGGEERPLVRNGEWIFGPDRYGHKTGHVHST